MKKSKRILAFVLTLVFVLSLSIMPVQAATKSKYKVEHPIVLVHGLFGYGEYDDLNALVPYWGYTTGSIDKYIESYGNECYEASVGPISSAWDRACELYAQLTGTVTDYGAYHSLVHGHDRYGRDYTDKGYGRLMKKEWNASNPINLIGHSFGGATSRLLLQLLTDGSKEERDYAAKHPSTGAVSSLFEGGKGNWVYSLTTLAAPSNGTTVCEAFSDLVNLVGEIAVKGAKLLSLTSFKGVYDFQLEHYGIYAKKGEAIDKLLDRIVSSGFMKHNDNAFQDLTIDKALDINSGIKMQSNVYYFSYYGDRTKRTLLGYSPNSRMFLPFKISGEGVCKYKGWTDGYYYDGYGSYKTKHYVKSTYTSGASWARNDGMVNVESGHHPFHYENGKRVDDAYVESYVGVKATRKGVWYVMPVVDADHLTFCGGIFNESRSDIQSFYRGVLSNLSNCGA
jgi:triacylglycerol lipase